MRRRFGKELPAFLILLGLLLSAILGGCRAPEPSEELSIDMAPRELFGRGLTLRDSQPLAAAAIFRDVGLMPGMERLRENLYFDSLKRGHADVEHWREFLEQRPLPELRTRALLIQAEELIEENRGEEAGAVLQAVEDDAPLEADRLMLEVPSLRGEAASRIIVRDPAWLHRQDPGLEKSLLPRLSAGDRLHRVEAWRRAGKARQALRELAHLPRAARNLEGYALLRSRCEQAVGRTRAALAALPALKSCDAGEARQRAEIYRRIGWSRYPGSSARSAFRRCLEAAKESFQKRNGTEVLEIELECGTESGDLNEAMKAWSALQARGWEGRRRSWDGRRLGRALIGSSPHLTLDHTMIPGQERCLRYWEAVRARPVDRKVLEDLGRVAIPDLYARWALKRLGREAPATAAFPAPSLPPPKMPGEISWLLEREEMDLAAAQFRHLGALRSLSPAEILAAVEVEKERNRPDLIIRYLRRGFGDLGSVGMSRYPRDLLRLYLPLQWEDALKRAAREAGISPWLLAGLARQESIFNADARSPAGAMGVVQLMPGTARGHARALGLGSRPDLRDPAVNLRIGARELAWLIRRFGAVEPALAAYNGGESRVRRWLKHWPDVEEMVENIPVPESYRYVRRVIFLSEAYRLVWADVWSEEAR